MEGGRFARGTLRGIVTSNNFARLTTMEGLLMIRQAMVEFTLRGIVSRPTLPSEPSTEASDHCWSKTPSTKFLPANFPS